MGRRIPGLCRQPEGSYQEIKRENGREPRPAQDYPHQIRSGILPGETGELLATFPLLLLFLNALVIFLLTWPEVFNPILILHEYNIYAEEVLKLDFARKAILNLRGTEIMSPVF